MVTAARQLSVVIPGLFGPAQIKQLPAAWQDLSLPGLEGLLARARRGSAEGRGLEQTLFALFQVAPGRDGDLPVAAVTRQWESQDAGGYWWLRADPVHLRADRDRIVMLGNTILDISAEECQHIALELNHHFAGEDWQLAAANARRWYLRLDQAPRIGTVALPDVVGQDILHAMPHGPAEAQWRSVMNEVQMVLHSSRINQEREARGALPINSLWFWGGGRLPCPVPVSWSQLWGNDALSQGLAALLRVACASLPPDATEWLQDDTPGEHLLVLDALREKIQFDDVEAWREFLQSLHDAWLEPLFAALKQGRVAALHLYPADGTVFHVTAGDARRWWVRRRSLAQWLS
jgi:hypothetical protein